MYKRQELAGEGGESIGCGRELWRGGLPVAGELLGVCSEPGVEKGRELGGAGLLEVVEIAGGLGESIGEVPQASGVSAVGERGEH